MSVNLTKVYKIYRANVKDLHTDSIFKQSSFYDITPSPLELEDKPNEFVCEAQALDYLTEVIKTSWSPEALSGTQFLILPTWKAEVSSDDN